MNYNEINIDEEINKVAAAVEQGDYAKPQKKNQWLSGLRH